MPTSPADPGLPLADLIDRLGRLVRAGAHAEGLNPAQWEALRYLERCNRFSNTPGALTLYLAATKGTVSQTLQALERKGLIARQPDRASRRVVRLILTEAGRRVVAHDPLAGLARAAEAVAPEARRGAAAALAGMLAELQRRNGRRPFGLCRTCRHFRKDVANGAPHYCALLETALTAHDSTRLCVEHELSAA